MCYYAEWDERFLQTDKQMRKSREQAEQLITQATKAATPSQPETSAEPVKKPVTEPGEVTV